MTIAPVYQPLGPCPCGYHTTGCHVVGTKLTRFGHLVGCVCHPCQGRRNKSNGQKNQSRILKAAARAQGASMEVAPTHEEQARLLVHYEIKSGKQVEHAGPRRLETWSKQAQLFAERQTPRKKWAVVLSYPSGRKRIFMDFVQWCELMEELVGES